MRPTFDTKLEAMLQSLYRNGSVNADFLPVPEDLESYSADAILDTHNMGRYADPHPLTPGVVKDALLALKERAEGEDNLQDPLARLGAELLRVMSLTADWNSDIPVAKSPSFQPVLVESWFTGTVEETFSFSGSFAAFAAGLRVRLSAKYRATPDKLEILDSKVLHEGPAVSQVKVLFQVSYTLARELDFPGPPVPVFATVTHSDLPLPEVSREVANVRHWARKP